MIMQSVALGLLASASIAGAAAPSYPLSAISQTGSGVATVLRSSTPVYMTVNTDMSSRNLAVGDMFETTVAQDVMLGDYVVIPRGTPGHGKVTWRTGRGVFGKSGKVEFELVDIELGGRLIRIGGGRYRIEGKGNTVATVASVVAVGLIGGLPIIGHSAIIDHEWLLKAYTWYDLPVTLPAGAVPVASH